MNKKRIILVLVILLLAGGGYYLWHLFKQGNQSELTIYGNVDIRSVNLSFRVNGRLASLEVDEGDKITANQILGRIDDAPYQNALEQAKANVMSAQAQLSLTKDGFRTEQIEQAKALVAQSQASYDFAQRYFERMQGLWKTRVISANDLDTARSSRDQAQANLKSAQDQLALYTNGNRPQEIESAQAALMQMKALQDQAELNLSDTVLRSPSNGTLLSRVVEPGTMLNAGSTVLTLSLTEPVWVRAYIDEVNLAYAVSGNDVAVYIDSKPDQPYKGVIGFVSPTAEFTPKNVETPVLRTDLVYRLRVIVKDADDALRQGMPVTIKLLSQQEKSQQD